MLVMEQTGQMLWDYSFLITVKRKLTLMSFLCDYFCFCVTGQAMPPPGSADSGSDEPPSESSDTATSEPKTFLVMSGGEGYIDFRMGEYVTALTKCIHKLHFLLV